MSAEDEVRTEGRLVRVETQVGALKEWSDKFEERVIVAFAGVNTKLDDLAKSVNVNKGREIQRASMWSIGGGLVGSGFTWLAEHGKHLLGP